MLNYRWLQMPCAACFQLNVHPGKNSFHRKHTSLDCTYMFWRLLESYQVFFFCSPLQMLKFFLAELEIRSLSAGKGPTNRERNLGFDHTRQIAFCADRKSSPVSYEHLSDMWLFTLEIRAVKPRSVTEIALKSAFLFVNRSPIRYGFYAGAKALRYSVYITSDRLPDGRQNTPKNQENRLVIPDGWRHEACLAYRIFFYQIHCVPWFRL